MHGLWLLCHALGQSCNLAQPAGKALVSSAAALCVHLRPWFVVPRLCFICSEACTPGRIDWLIQLNSGEKQMTNCLEWICQVVPEKKGSSVLHLCCWKRFMGMLMPCQLIKKLFTHTPVAFFTLNWTRLLIIADWKWRKLISFFTIKPGNGA